MYSGGVVLGASTTVASAIVLPNTGGNILLTVTSAIALLVGVAVLASSVARIAARKAFKA